MVRTADQPYKPGTMKTYSGIYVDPLEMELDDIRIVDIAHALARQGRYNGHYPVFRSVAQHSIEVAGDLLARYPLDPKLALTGLLHDASEAYVGDMVNPLKRQTEMAGFVEAEEALQEVIAAKYGLVFPFYLPVHEADARNGELEREHWRDGGSIARITENHHDVEQLFIEIFLKLGGVDEHLEGIR